MQCPICGADVNTVEQMVATRGGGVVHLHCSEREAAQAWERRRGRAVVLVEVTLAAWWLTHKAAFGVLLGLGLLIVHFLSNRRWWYYIQRDLTTWVKRTSFWRARR